ncbi:MAG: GTPase Era [Limnochordia bacterium]|jgi:GTP-binding protein Era|nr:GTPase Era [Limnochordia bacterium]MDD2628710.1 GTPase Era [Limnochordia bacterium]MDD4517059.1 GTPase Era [Limnochordia bacterium]
MEVRSGFVAVVGRPNVGKSTLVNYVIGSKVAIVSEKPQTTRNQVQGVLTREDAQVVFIDTPGLHVPKHKLGQYMVRQARTAVSEVDVVVFVFDGSAGFTSEDERIYDELRELSGKGPELVVVANKADAMAEAQRKRLQNLKFSSLMLVSALTGQGVEEFLALLISKLPLGPKYYPDDWVSAHPEQFIVAEFIREKVLRSTEEEVPHAVAVIIEDFRQREQRELIDIRATIIVERDSQKGIIIGKGGRMLKSIGQAARLDIEALLGSQVNLQLWVKVKKNWRKNEDELRRLGYR